MLSSSLWLQAAHKLIFTWFVQKTISSHSEIKSCIHPVLSWQCSKIIPMQILQPAITHSSHSPGPITFSEKVASSFLRSVIPQLLQSHFTRKKFFCALRLQRCLLFSLPRWSNQKHNPLLVHIQWVNPAEACSSQICHRNIFLEVALQSNSQNRAWQKATLLDIYQQQISAIHFF